MKMIWPWKKYEVCDGETCSLEPSDEAKQALEDSFLIKETADLRWRRVDEAVDRAVAADKLVRSQREQNHLREIVFAALHKDIRGHA